MLTLIREINKVYWREAHLESRASTIVETRRVMLKPSLGLGRLRVVGLASHYLISWVFNLL